MRVSLTKTVRTGSSVGRSIPGACVLAIYPCRARIARSPFHTFRCPFGAFKRDRGALAQWAVEIAPRVVVEGTGVYLKGLFAALEAVSIIAWVANAHHVKAVPGRKTDVADAQ
jgi:transposase